IGVPRSAALVPFARLLPDIPPVPKQKAPFNAARSRVAALAIKCTHRGRFPRPSARHVPLPDKTDFVQLVPRAAIFALAARITNARPLQYSPLGDGMLTPIRSADTLMLRHQLTNPL